MKTSPTAHASLKNLYDLLQKGDPGERLRENLSNIYEIPVLNYHQVVEEIPATVMASNYITRQTLERQFQFLKDRGFETITFIDMLTRKIPPKPVLLTFDDGYENNYFHMFPLLERHGMKAVLFILGDRKIRHNDWDLVRGESSSGLLKPRQIREMVESGRVEFGGHSMTHVKLPPLPSRQRKKEVADCKSAVEDATQKPVVSFAYPYGESDERVKAETAKAGYWFGLSGYKGPSRFREDLMAIRRIGFSSAPSAFSLFLKTSGYYLRLTRLVGKKY